MKAIKYLSLALAAMLLTACQGDWDDPDTSNAYGNGSITETNVITIQQLKDMYPNETASITSAQREAYTEITEDVQVKGVITCNDVQGNMYREVAIQDETGAILIGIMQSGVYGYLPLGTEILVNLKGLYIGNYRFQAKIGWPYKSQNKNTKAINDYVSGMPFAIWQEHFKYTGQKKAVEPEVFADGSAKTTWDFLKDSGKLGILKNVTFSHGQYISYDEENNMKFNELPYNEDSKYADPKYETSISWYFNEQETSIQLYNSNYAKFASNKLPQGKVNVTGVLKRYNNYWEFIIRDMNDIQPAE